MTRKLVQTCWWLRLWSVLVLFGAAAIVAACGGGDGGGGGSAPPPGPTQTLTVDKNGGGAGTVSSSPSGVQCGTTCAGSFPQGTTVTLNATPSPGSTFSGWGSVCPGTGPCAVTLSNDMTVPANFSGSGNDTLTVVKSGSGTVNSTNPPGVIQCGAQCSNSFAPNTQVTLTAVPDPGASFLGWGGPCSGTSDCTVTVGGNVIVQANFSSGGPFDFSLAVTPSSQVVFTGANAGYTVTATLLTAPGSAVPVTFDVLSGCPVNATCTFSPNPVTPTASGAITNLVVSTTSSTAIAPASIVIRGVGGGVTHTTPVQLKVVQLAASATPPRFAYAANSDDDTVSIYTVSMNPGELRHRGYVKTGDTPFSVATDPAGKFVYVANRNVGTISSYVVTQPPSPEAGSLTPIGSAVSSGKLTNAVLVNPTKDVLYAVNFATSTTISAGSVSAFSFDPATGLLTPIGGSPFTAGQSSTGIAIDPAGKFAYVGNYPANPIQQPPISGYLIQANGGLTPIALTNLFPNLSAAIAIDPKNGKFLFTADDVFDRVLVYLVNSTTGALTQVQSVSTASAPVGLSVDPSGRFLYVANQGADKVSGYAINQTTGQLTAVPNSPFAAGTGPSSVTVDPSGNFVYATNLSADTVSAYFLDQGTGELTPLGLTRTRQEPAAMAITKGATPVTYVPKFAYTANQGSENLSEFSINAATGQLLPLAQTTVVTGSPVALATTPSWKFAYVVRNTAPTNVGLAGFVIDSVTGFLNPTPTPAFGTGTNPLDVTIDSSGRFLYVVNQNQVWRYQINTATGNLNDVAVVAVNAGTNPVSVTTDPTGQFLYAANQGSNNVSEFAIDSGSGNLTAIPLSPVAVGTTPQSVVAEQSGQFVYVATAGTVPGRISGFKIQTGGQTGQLVSVGSPFTAGLTPVNLAVDPYGKWVFVTNSGDGTLSVYRVNNATGTLSLVSAPIPVGNKPDGVTVDPSGKFVYVTIWGPDTPPSDPRVVAYALDQGTGLLTLVNSFAVGTQPRAVKTTGTIQ